MTKINMENKCFISASTGAALDVLTSTLKMYGYYIYVPNILTPGELWIDTLRRKLSEVDLVVGVLQPNLSTSNVIFELGLAAGLGKRVIVIAPSEIIELPQAFSAFLIIRASSTNREAIEFALEQIAIAPKKQSAYDKIITKPVKILGNKIDQYIHQMGEIQTEYQIIEILRQLFIASGVDIVVSEPNIGENKRPDLVLWSTLLGSYIGNPLIIEVKKQIHSLVELQRALNQIQKYMTISGSMWSILLYINGPDSEKIKPFSQSFPNIIIIPMNVLLERLRHESFIDIVRTFRNMRAHGVSS